MRHDSFQTLSFLHPSPIRKLLKSLSFSLHRNYDFLSRTWHANTWERFCPPRTCLPSVRHASNRQPSFAYNAYVICSKLWISLRPGSREKLPLPYFFFFSEREKSFDLNNSSNRDEYEARYLRHEKQILNRYFEIRIVSRNETILKQ